MTLTERVIFRTTKQEKKQLIQRAENNNMSVGTFIRFILNQPNQTNKRIDELREHLYSEFDNVIDTINKK